MLITMMKKILFYARLGIFGYRFHFSLIFYFEFVFGWKIVVSVSWIVKSTFCAIYLWLSSRSYLLFSIWRESLAFRFSSLKQSNEILSINFVIVNRTDVSPTNYRTIPTIQHQIFRIRSILVRCLFFLFVVCGNRATLRYRTLDMHTILVQCFISE